MKKNKGITLVALVITIIVLLILAGVSISLVVGDNGVLTQAQNAKSETKKADADNAMNLSLSSLSTNFMANEWKDDTSAKIYDYVTAGELEYELENYGFKIYKIGASTATPTATEEDKSITDSTILIDGDAKNSNEIRTTLDVYIYDNGITTLTNDSNVYKYTLEFKSNDTVVSATPDKSNPVAKSDVK